MMQHWAMYTGKRIIPQNIIYIYNYIYYAEVLADFVFFFSQMNQWGGWLGLGFKIQPFLNHLSIFTHTKKTVTQIYIIIKKEKKNIHAKI